MLYRCLALAIAWGLMIKSHAQLDLSPWNAFGLALSCVLCLIMATSRLDRPEYGRRWT